MLLDAVTQSLEILLAGAVATNQLPVVVNYRDGDTRQRPVVQHSQTNGITAVTIVTAPASKVNRTVSFLSVVNVDTAAATVTIRLNDNSVMRPILKIILAIGDNLSYTEGEGFQVLDVDGKKKVLSSPRILYALLEGEQGEPGEQGFPGTQGVQGAPGIPGFLGAEGEPGEDSLIPGPQGLVGATGAQGATGLQGTTGAQGPVGPPVFLVGEEPESLLDVVPGPQGIQGPTGAQGPAGPPIFLTSEEGDEGPIGAQGIPGVQGAIGATGPAGAAGAPGPLGPPGIDGEGEGEGGLSGNVIPISQFLTIVSLRA